MDVRPASATPSRDGADGDASTLAALCSYLLDGYPASRPATRVADFGGAHFAIYCADFSDVAEVLGLRGDAGGRSAAGDRPVDVAEPILVVGTAYDPPTPGRHAAELAAALGDAVVVTWEGVGHTAFPVDRRASTSIVVELPRRRRPAADGATCPFVDGADDRRRARRLPLRLPRVVDRGRGSRMVLEAEGEPPDQAACEARRSSPAPTTAS